MFALASGFVLMWPMWNAGPLVLDEHGSYWMIDSDLPGNTLSRSLNYCAIPPLSGWLQQATLAVFGKSERTFRLPSAICYFGAIVVMYFAGSEIRDGQFGGLAALALAWHPESLDEVRIARCYGLVLLMATLVVLAACRWIRSPLSRGAAVFWAFTSAGLLWTHYTSALLLIMTSASLCIRILRGGHRRQRSAAAGLWFAANVLLAILCLPLVPAILRVKEWGPFLNYMPESPAVHEFIGSIWWLGIPAGWLTVRILTGLLVSKPIDLAVESQRPQIEQPLSQRSDPPTVRHMSLTTSCLLLSACSLVPLGILIVLASGDLSSLANPRYRVAYAPGCAGLLALAVSGSRRAVPSVAAIVVALIVCWCASPAWPWDLWRLGGPADADWHQVNQFIAKNSDAGEVIFVQSGLAESRLVPAFPDDPVFLEYVACRVSRFSVEANHPRIGLPFLWEGAGDVRSHFETRLRELHTGGSSFLVASATDTDLNRRSLAGIRQLADSNGFSRTESHEWPNAILERYAPSPGTGGEAR